MTKPADSKQAIPSPEDRVRALCDWLEDEAIERMKHAMSREESARSMRGATAKDLRDAKVLAEKMAGRRLHGVNTSPEHAALEAEAQDRIATKLATEARQLSAWASLVEELKGQVAAKEKERGQWQALFMESEEYNCSCNIADTAKPVGDPMNYVCDWHERHPDITKARNETFPLVWRAETAEAEADLLRKRKDYHAEYVEAVEAAEKAKRERDEYLETGQRIQGDFERAKEAYVCSERELGVMREALQEIASYEDEIFAKQIALKALTPEPASQEAKEKK